MRDITHLRPRVALIASVTLVALAMWGFHHVLAVEAALQGAGGQFAMLFAGAFLLLAGRIALAYLHKPTVVTPRKQRQLDAMHVAVVVPAYNEDPPFLARCLRSLLMQTRLPDTICVTDDGSTADYAAVRREFTAQARQLGVTVQWVRTANHGKRAAQGEAFTSTPAADIYVTIDSDAELTATAIDELLKPFSRPEVSSVAGMVLVAEHRKNLLTRLTDLNLAVFALLGRAPMSILGAVLVNSGCLSAYRADVVRGCLDVYLDEKFCGRRVDLSDDAMLTFYALMDGHAVQQPSAIAFTTMPERVGHHLRQYTRWFRGNAIRTLWRFRYLSMRRPAFWVHAVQWMQAIVTSVLFVIYWVLMPASALRLIPMLLAVPVVITFAQSLLYLTLRRPDEPFWSSLLTVALSPVAAVWSLFVLRFVFWYGLATCWKSGWGTRQTIEIRAAAPAGEAGTDLDRTTPLPVVQLAVPLPVAAR